jgi:hypothetical protein
MPPPPPRPTLALGAPARCKSPTPPRSSSNGSATAPSARSSPTTTSSSPATANSSTSSTPSSPRAGLTDAAFLDSLAFITVLWRCFNATARHNIEAIITESDDIDTAWISAAVDYGKVEQFIHSILNLYDATPDLTEIEDNTTYQLRPLT